MSRGNLTGDLALEVVLDQVDWRGQARDECAAAARDVVVGTAYLARGRGRVSTTFTYDPRYLVGGGIAIDPALRCSEALSTSVGSCVPSRTALRTVGGDA